MVIYYNIKKPSSTSVVKSVYKENILKNQFSQSKNLKRLTRKNIKFLQSLGFKINNEYFRRN